MFGNDKDSFLKTATLLGLGYIFGHVAGQKSNTDQDEPVERKPRMERMKDAISTINSFSTLLVFMAVWGPYFLIQILLLFLFYIPFLLVCVGSLLMLAILPFLAIFTLGPTPLIIGLSFIWLIFYCIIGLAIREQIAYAQGKPNPNRPSPAVGAKVDVKPGEGAKPKTCDPEVLGRVFDKWYEIKKGL